MAVSAGCAAPVKGDLSPKSGRRVIVVGGGWGGATAAKYIRLQDPSIEVVLLEPNRTFVSLPFSNLVLSGVETLDALTLRYDGLRAHSVKIRHEAATALEPDTKRVRIGEGYLEYDRLVVAPGVDFLWSQVDGVAGQEPPFSTRGRPAPRPSSSPAALQALPDGGVVVMTVPAAPYRCPPGPLRARLPDRLVPQDQEAPGQADRPRRQQRRHLQGRPLQGGLPRLPEPRLPPRPHKLERVDLGAREVVPTVGERVRYDLLNLIPPQSAGAIALQAGLAEATKPLVRGEPRHLRVDEAAGVHVIGDATIGLPVPKSGNIANATGKICATAT